MTDEEMAQDIRAKTQALYDACHAARTAGLEVTVPLLYLQWMISGHGPGGPSDWIIRRKSL
jgi:hypothetical protein